MKTCSDPSVANLSELFPWISDVTNIGVGRVTKENVCLGSSIVLELNASIIVGSDSIMIPEELEMLPEIPETPDFT